MSDSFLSSDDEPRQTIQVKTRGNITINSECVHTGVGDINAAKGITMS